MGNKNNRSIFEVDIFRLKKKHKRTLMIVAIVGILLEIVWLQELATSKNEARLNETKAYGQVVATSIQLLLDKCISGSETMNDMYLHNSGDFALDFMQLGSHLVESNSVIESTYFAPNAVIQYAYPAHHAESTIGFEMLKDPEQAEYAQKAIDMQAITVAGPHKLVEGGVGFIIRNPIFVDGEFKAFSIIILDWDRFVKQIVDNLADDGKNYHFAVWKANDEHAVTDKNGFIISSCDHAISKDINVPIPVANDMWYLAVEPTGSLGRWSDMKSEIITSSLLLIIILVAVYMRLLSSEKIVRSMEYDKLTGLYTKQAFYTYAKELMNRYPGEEFDIVVADIENFKMINGMYGEETADAALKFVGELLSQRIGSGITCRFSGDQFVHLGRAGAEGNATWVGELAKVNKKSGPIPDMKVKYGIYQKVDKSLPISIICDRALVALRSIKQNYERDYAFYDGPISRHELQTRIFETSFNESIEKREFKIWFQPKFNAKTEELVGAEALVRWIREDGTMISPGAFIPVFERDGLIAELDEYIFRRVCEHIKEWQKLGYHIVPISVNLSRASLVRDDVVERYRKIAEGYDIPVEWVPIEITESAEYSSNNITDLANGLKSDGFALYMDDFGSGFSSLASLNTLPFDVVKLDKSLIDYIGDQGGREIIRHTIELAHFKGMEVVAEGVETIDQLEELRKLDCDTIQGYYFSKPKPCEEFEKYIQ